MSFLLAGVCILTWSKLTGHRTKTVSVPRQPAQIKLAQMKPAPAPAPARLAVARSHPSVPRVFADAKPVAPEPADENEKFLQQFDPKLLKNPKLEDFIRDRLWLALDQLNNPLIKKLGLSSDEIAAFKELAVSNLVAATEQAETAAGPGPAEVESAIDHALTARQVDFDARLRLLLGDARFAQYENGVEDYSQFNGIKFLDGGSPPLTDARAEQIISVMQSERQKVNAAAVKIENEEAAPLSAGDYLQMQELIVGRTYERLQNVLLPRQLTAFGQFELQQLDSLQANLNPGRNQSISPLQ